MDSLTSWLLGFVLWFFIIAIIALITFTIGGGNIEKYRGHIPNDVFNYSYRPDFIPKDAFLIDMHSHTIASDGWMTPEQNIIWHKINGFNAFVLTDHNTGKNNSALMALQEKYPDLVLIPGYEWTTGRIHINLCGIEDFPGRVPDNPSNEQIQQVIKQAQGLGAFVQVDHISWTVDQPRLRSGELVHPTRDQLYEWGIDAYEINNEMRWYDPLTLHWFEQRKAAGTLKRPIAMTTGTDIHSPLKEWASCWTEVLLTPEEKKKPTWAIIKKAMLEGRTKIWVDHDYRCPPESKSIGATASRTKQILLAPLLGLRNGIEKIPGGVLGILSYIFWALIAYFPLRLVFEWIAHW